MAMCVCCSKDGAEYIVGSPPICKMCGEKVSKYLTARSAIENYYNGIAGYAPIKINPDSKLKDELQEINDRIEKMRIEMLFLQVAVYNIGQDTLNEKCETEKGD